MPSLSLFKISEAILAQAKDLLGGDNGDAPTRPEDPSYASTPDVDGKWDTVTLDETFWATLLKDDRRLAELRRAVDEAAAEVMALEVIETDEPSCSTSQIGESRWEAANRKITDALKAEKP